MISTLAADTIGDRLRALRKREGWTLTEVASRTGISQGTLSKLENGRTKLNFSSVVKLASGLNLPVTDFTNAEVAPAISGARRSVTRAGAGLRFQGHDIEYEVLADGLAGMRNVFLRARIKQQPNPDPAAFRRHPGQEFIYVVSGELQLETEAYAPIRLQEGDSVVFDSSMGHRYVSVSEADTILLIEMEVASYPTVIEDLVI
ncbi:helix-turn-helix domain-containing protein [Sphingomonas sp. So64.6b]|uniref:helix-turn-helix domain-containing protein n=1 Tax=Sphingomonas sp. So64.6b TaxID=2997354 RepID=UPI001603ED49|nr:XRE family transcriptional regulator [Sphingomonas sp. So64.6b]QNA86320.1 helix-turn-helix domain-containing protein [Sphingomonas sp. So64.6b]